MKTCFISKGYKVIVIPSMRTPKKVIAMAAKARVPNSSLVFTGKYGKDERTYKVSFKRIYKVLLGLLLDN